MPCASSRAYRCSTTNTLPHHRASGWDVLINPSGGLGREWVEEEDGALVVNVANKNMFTLDRAELIESIALTLCDIGVNQIRRGWGGE